MKISFTGIASIMVLCIAISFSGCNKPQPTPTPNPDPDPVISYTGDSAFEIPEAGGSKTITFNANRDWSIKSDASWIHISPGNGSSSGQPVTVTITCDPNTGNDARSATITISINGASKTITVSQPASASTPFLDLISESVVNLDDASAGETVVSFSTNQEWSISTNSQWLHIAQTSGTASNSPINITVSIDQNYAFEEREGSVTVSAGNIERTVSIKQPAASTVLELTCSSEFDVEEDEGCCCQSGVTISFITNRDWTISSDASWIHFDKASGKASEDPIGVLASIDNDITSPRSATVTISVPGITRSVQINQTVVPTDVPYVRTVFFEDFEDLGHLDNWTFIDRDNDGYMWSYMVSTEGQYNVHSGNTCLSSESYTNDNYAALTPDNWIFTPEISLPANDCYVSLWVCPQDSGYPEEHFGVYVSEIKPNTADPLINSTMIHQSTITKGSPVKTEIVGHGKHEMHIAKIPDSFKGKSVYIGIRHFNSSDQYRINLDDVSVTEGYPEIPNASPTAVQLSHKKYLTRE